MTHVQTQLPRFPQLSKPDNAWIEKKLRETPVKESDYVNTWVAKSVAEAYVYNFYFDDKYHWIVKHPNGQDQVVDPELWAKFLNRDKMIDGLWYLGTTVVDAIYGAMDLGIEIRWDDGMVREVRLVAPDGDLIKANIKRFYISRPQPL